MSHIPLVTSLTTLERLIRPSTLNMSWHATWAAPTTAKLWIFHRTGYCPYRTGKFRWYQVLNNNQSSGFNETPFFLHAPEWDSYNICPIVIANLGNEQVTLAHADLPAHKPAICQDASYLHYCNGYNTIVSSRFVAMCLIFLRRWSTRVVSLSLFLHFLYAFAFRIYHFCFVPSIVEELTLSNTTTTQNSYYLGEKLTLKCISSEIPY